MFDVCIEIEAYSPLLPLLHDHVLGFQLLLKICLQILLGVLSNLSSLLGIFCNTAYSELASRLARSALPSLRKAAETVK